MAGSCSEYGAARSFVQAVTLLFALLLAAPVSAAGDRLVLAFGDSLTAGYGLAPAQAFPVRLEAALRRAGVAARVRNAGVSGGTSPPGGARSPRARNRVRGRT